MISLKDLNFSLKKILHNLSLLTNMEFAIFDTKANLLSSTELYLKYKGNKVHSTSINEVLTQENVIVNKPGYMESCIGCRFVNNCPSTIEILSCIKLNNISIGVISLTSFSKDKHNLIESNIKDYMEILKNASNLISIFAISEFNKSKYSFQNAIINKIIDMNEEHILVIDKDGMVTNCSHPIQEMFSFCDLYTNSIKQILPDNVVSWILNSTSIVKKYVNNKRFTGNIVNCPIIFENQISAFVITLKQDNTPGIRDNEPNYLKSIITEDPIMKEIKNKIKKIANSPSSVLITGETGTGKEMVAKAIHFSSNRRNNPFVPINCANIPDTLFESELFGYEEGAFTGAKRGGKMGMFEIANGGTVFLDEIGELPLHLQSKLLRVLQESTIHRLGSITPIPINVRIISATNKNLEQMIYMNKFREDLYYRLNVIPLNLPPLSQRREDIKLLSNYFLEKYNNRLNKNIVSISNETLAFLENYHWKGNIRELENAIEYAVNMEETSNITMKNLPFYVRNKNLNVLNKVTVNEEENIILSILNKHGWSVEGKKLAAEELGISLRTLYRRLKEIEV